MEPPPAVPPRFSSGGGHGIPLHPRPREGECDAPTHDAEDNVHPRRPQHSPPQPPIGTAPMGDLNLSQRIAERMLTAHVPATGSDCRRNEWEAHEVGMLPGAAAPRPMPPWEPGVDPDLPVVGTRGDLPPTQLHRAMAMHPSLNLDNFDALNLEDDENDRALTDNPTTITTATATAKSVTFGTHDQIFQWDEAFEVLKYVDEEFFSVADYLLDVVGTNDISDDEYRLNMASFEEEYQREHQGLGLLSLLFGCSAGGEAGSISAMHEGQTDGNDQYRLTKKLVDDFYAAAKFRVQSMGPDASDDEEDSVVERTKDVVRRINAYGLPLLGSDAKIDIGCDIENGVPSPSLHGENIVDHVDNGEEDQGEFLDTFGRGVSQQFFPVLPVDDENDCGADENDHSLSNLLRRKSRATKDSPSKASSFKLPTPTSILSSLKIKPKSSTPSEEECRKRLVQIRHEMQKVKRMIDNTRTEAVRLACQNRMDRLRDERRFYEIVQERYKIQSMMETTEVEVVRSACRERFQQLISELETLHLEDDNEDKASEGDKEPPGKDNKSAGEDGRWYDRVLQYVNAGEPYPEEVPEYSQGGNQPEQDQNMRLVNYPEMNGSERYETNRQVLSPRTDSTHHARNNFRYAAQSSRQHAPRRPPVATAVKSRNAWFG